MEALPHGNKEARYNSLKQFSELTYSTLQGRQGSTPEAILRLPGTLPKFQRVPRQISAVVMWLGPPSNTLGLAKPHDRLDKYTKLPCPFLRVLSYCPC